MHERKILAVASAGGHWVQLMRLRPAFDRHQVRFLSTNPQLGAEVLPCRLHSVRDASMWDKLGLLAMSFQVAKVILAFRPDVVVTTGAAPGFFAIVLGKLAGAKTIWIDSIANAEGMSLAGRKAGRWCDHWLTQWPDLVTEDGPDYIGSVI